LEVSDIEDAGIRDVLQIPGAAYGAWSVLDTLLAATGSAERFETAALAVGQSAISQASARLARRT